MTSWGRAARSCHILRAKTTSARSGADPRATPHSGWSSSRTRAARLARCTCPSRADARRFYEGLGFEASHVGMELAFKEP